MYDKEKYIEAIERINMDYLQEINGFSEEWEVGHKVLLLKECFPFKLISLYRNHKKWADIDAKVSKLAKTDNEPIYANPGKEVTGVCGTLYTCITGTYDRLYDPVIDVENLDNVAFTDNPALKSEKWEIRKISKLQGVTENYTNRYYKLHPAEFFGNRNYSIYVDGNVQVVSDVSRLYAIANESKIGIAMHKHTERDCIFAEGQACIYHGRGNAERIKIQLGKYRDEGMPEHYGLLEATVIVVDLHNEIAIDLLNQWWEEFNYWKSGRDQLAFSYVLWKNGYLLDDAGILGNNKFMNPKFRIRDHAEWRK